MRSGMRLSSDLQLYYKIRERERTMKALSFETADGSVFTGEDLRDAQERVAKELRSRGDFAVSNPEEYLGLPSINSVEKKSIEAERDLLYRRAKAVEEGETLCDLDAAALSLILVGKYTIPSTYQGFKVL
jgi:hypothetical protein